MKLPKFWESLDKFLKFIRLSRCLSSNTLKAYKADLTQFGKFWTDRCQSFEIGQAVNNFILSILYDQKLCPKTLARKFSSLKTFAKFLSRQGINISISGKAPKIRTKLPDILSVEEVSFLGAEIEKNIGLKQFPKRDLLIFELLYATGMRSFELSSIKIESIDFENKTIRIWGKGLYERLVLFGDRAKDCLENYLKFERPKLKKSHKTKNTFLFLNWKGGQLETRAMRKIFEDFSKILGNGRKITPHTLRHSFATHMLNAGVDLRVVQELLGHKRITATQIYTQISVQGIADFFKKSHPIDEMEDQIFIK